MAHVQRSTIAQRLHAALNQRSPEHRARIQEILKRAHDDARALLRGVEGARGAEHPEFSLAYGVLGFAEHLLADGEDIVLGAPDPTGAIYGTGKYEALDTGWLQALAEWIETGETRASFRLRHPDVARRERHGAIRRRDRARGLGAARRALMKVSPAPGRARSRPSVERDEPRLEVWAVARELLGQHTFRPDPVTLGLGPEVHELELEVPARVDALRRHVVERARRLAAPVEQIDKADARAGRRRGLACVWIEHALVGSITSSVAELF